MATVKSSGQLPSSTSSLLEQYAVDRALKSGLILPEDTHGVARLYSHNTYPAFACSLRGFHLRPSPQDSPQISHRSRRVKL